MKVTLPVGVPPAAVPVTVALSWTVEPIGAEVIAAAAAVSSAPAPAWMTGAVPLSSLVAVSGSQDSGRAVVDGAAVVGGLERAATDRDDLVAARVSDAVGVEGDGALAGGRAVAGRLEYQVKVTLPVGVPPAAVPVTVALSWTVEPIGAEVIAAAAAVSSAPAPAWMTVTVPLSSLVAVSGSQAPVEPL